MTQSLKHYTVLSDLDNSNTCIKMLSTDQSSSSNSYFIQTNHQTQMSWALAPHSVIGN